MGSISALINTHSWGSHAAKTIIFIKQRLTLDTKTGYKSLRENAVLHVEDFREQVVVTLLAVQNNFPDSESEGLPVCKTEPSAGVWRAKKMENFSSTSKPD